MDNNTGELSEYVPMYLERHPSIFARLIYRLGFKLCKWMNEDNKKYTLTLDGNYIERD
jgi:hypothetical protein|tara:strand:- start:5 stop:178 length:174 start_codon:yes stop_codon:yes gene_type:complete